MTDELNDDEARGLWREAARRLRAIDVEPPFAMARVDALRRALGPRRPDQDLRSWLRGETTDHDADSAGGNVVAFDPKRQRLRPVATFTRLAADTAGGMLRLPERELETHDGRFRLRARSDGEGILLELQALGIAADDFAGLTVALVSLEDDLVPVALLDLDEDGDGRGRFSDAPDLRRALLRPVIALVEEI